MVANIGNFINRTLSFLNSKFENTIPNGVLDKDVEDAINNAFNKVGESINNCEFVKSTDELLKFGDFCNKYFNDKAPWVSYKENIKESENTIYNSIQLVNALRILIKPFLPKTSVKIANILNIHNEYDPNIELEESGEVKRLEDSWAFKTIPSNSKLNTPEILFEKILEN